jgi:CRISPR-associated helicase Cas3/CRISPR-associated endonuclease Cas3-HD
LRFIAHKNEDGAEQALKDHLLGVAELTREYASIFHAGELGYAAGLLHDLGKYKAKFQARIRGQPVAVAHSSTGALAVRERWRQLFGAADIHGHLAQLVQFAIAFHHGGLRNYGTKDEDGSLVHRLEAAAGSPEEQEVLNGAAWKEIDLPSLSIPTDGRLVAGLLRHNNLKSYSWKLAFLGRMLYSCLVDADTVDTRNFSDPASTGPASLRVPTLAELSDRLDQALDARFAHAPDTTINQYRKSILDDCRRQAQLTPRLFTLTVPTGGGKTFSSLAFALRHAQAHGLRRIIYVIPFTSIIEQNAEQIRQVLGREAVLEHHSNFDLNEVEEQLGEAESRRYKLSMENWDAPVVVTTSVQFFESLFSNRRTRCRKLHNIARSVIVLDEAQSLPCGYLEPCLLALEELIESYGCSAVLCTATQPSWTGLGRQVKEIMDKHSPAELYEDVAFRRVTVEMRDELDAATEDARLAEWLREEPQALCIVNTRKHAKLLLDQFNSGMDGLYHLSGRMTPRHRMSALREIRDRLRDGRTCLVISTQLIEAGVDVDFPVVYRALAGLDSIAQAAGRCNREGRLKNGRLIVFHPEQHGMPTKGWLKVTATEALNSIRKFGISEALSLKCLKEYFERIHGIRDEEAGPRLRDQEGIIEMLTRQPAHIPYEDVAERFQLIDSAMDTVIVPWQPPEHRIHMEDPHDPEALQLIERLAYDPYPASVLRRLQPYAVQVYHHELRAYAEQRLLRQVQGVWVLNDLAYYDPLAGLLSPNEETEPAVYIF